MMTIKEILNLPKDLAKLIDCMGCESEKIVENVRVNGVILEKVRARAPNSGGKT